MAMASTIAMQLYLDDDEDDEEMECQIVLALLTTLPFPRAKIENYMDTVSRYTDEVFRRLFRLSRDTFYTLVDFIKECTPERENFGGVKPIAIEVQLYITLWYLSGNDTIQKISDRFGVGEATVLQCRKRIIKIILQDLNKRFVVWPTPEEMLEEETLFAARNGFPGIIGALDGTHIPISKPKEHPQSYVNRKGFHSIQLQAICLHDMRFCHIYVGYPGSVHDARVLRNSDLWDAGLQLCNMQYHILADGAYPLRRWLLTPFRNNGHLTAQEKRYNNYHSSNRVVIERAFGHLKGRFRRLLILQTQSVKTACKIIMACCVLHNICIMQGDVQLSDFLDDYEELDDVQPNLLIHENDAEGALKRIRIANDLV